MAGISRERVEKRKDTQLTKRGKDNGTLQCIHVYILYLHLLGEANYCEIFVNANAHQP